MSSDKLNGGDREQDAPFELRVLGSFELAARPAGELVPVSTMKMRALLAYLAAAPRFADTRRRLAGLLWAGSGEDQARQSLRQLLSNFRKGTRSQASGIITFDETTVSLDMSAVAIDRTALMKVRPDADVTELGRIADRYRDEFGLGLELGEPDFDAWLQAERVRIREAAISLFDRLIHGLIALERHGEALARANRLAEIDPLREETHRLVIAQEAIVSGRASAMLRYEAFRTLLRDELGVRPEPATLRLLDDLRQPRPEAASAEPAATVADVQPAPTSPVTAVASRAATSRWRPAALAAILALAVLLGGVVLKQAGYLFGAPLAYVGEDAGRVSVVVLPFEIATADEELRARARMYEAETKLAFTRNNRLSVVEFPETVTVRDPISVGRLLRVRYVVKTSLSETAGHMQADVSLFDSTTGISVSAAPEFMADGKIKFARELFRYVYPEIVLHHDRMLSATDPDSISALLWRAEAARIRTRVGGADPEEFSLFEAVLARDPNQVYALQGSADALILRVAREQSPDRLADINRATALLIRARERAPNMPEIAFDEGMLNKLQGKYEPAGLDFERAFRLDRTHWNAAAQAAHVKIFLGRFEEAYSQMETATAYLLPDIAAAETAYIAAETALVAGYPERAVAYLDIAIAGNPAVARIRGMHAAALWMAGRETDARAAAALSQTLTPAYTPELMAQRGRATSTARYKMARDAYVAAYRAALAPASTN